MMYDDIVIIDMAHKHCRTCFDLGVYQGNHSLNLQRAHPDTFSRKSTVWQGEHRAVVLVELDVEAAR